MGQTFQKLTKIVKSDLMGLKKSGINNLDGINIQHYFYKKKQENPKGYERMLFDTPLSGELEKIKADLINSGFLKYSLVIVGEQ